MKFLTLTSSLALAACLAFSGSAMAQTMVGGVEISAGDVGKFQEKCAALAAAANQSLAGDQATEAMTTDTGAQSAPADPAAKANVEMLLGSLTAEQCMEANMMPEGTIASGSGNGQAMIGTMAIPEANMADFQAKCAAIASAATESLASPEDDVTETGAVVADDALNTSADLANKDNLDQLLASLTPEQCQEAGLLPGGPVPTTTQ